MATHESDLQGASSRAGDPPATVADEPARGEREENPSSEPERSVDLELAIQTIASRILAASLIERAQEAESIAT